MTTVEYLKEKLTSVFVNDNGFNKLFDKAKEMEKQQIIDCLNEFSDETLSDEFCDKYIAKTYGSKGIALQNQSESKVIIELDNLPKEVKKVSFGEISEHAILTEATNRYTIEDEIEAFIQGAEWMKIKLGAK